MFSHCRSLNMWSLNKYFVFGFPSQLKKEMFLFAVLHSLKGLWEKNQAECLKASIGNERGNRVNLLHMCHSGTWMNLSRNQLTWDELLSSLGCLKDSGYRLVPEESNHQRSLSVSEKHSWYMACVCSPKVCSPPLPENYRPLPPFRKTQAGRWGGPVCRDVNTEPHIPSTSLFHSNINE